MTKNNNLEITAYNNGELVRDKHFINLHQGIKYVDGYKLDEMNIKCSLYNTDDIDDLIKLLQIARKLFYTYENRKQ